jgi:hypothetical protein
MSKRKALEDINRSALSFKNPNTFGKDCHGIIVRVVTQYGPKNATWAAERSNLSPIQIGWIKRYAADLAEKERKDEQLLVLSKLPWKL